MAEKRNFEDPGFTPIEPDPQYILQVNGLKKYFPCLLYTSRCV